MESWLLKSAAFSQAVLISYQRILHTTVMDDVSKAEYQSRIKESVTCATATVQTQCIAGGAEPEKAEPAFAQKMIVRKNGIEVEMPADISEKLLLTLLRGLKEC